MFICRTSSSGFGLVASILSSLLLLSAASMMMMTQVADAQSTTPASGASTTSAMSTSASANITNATAISTEPPTSEPIVTTAENVTMAPVVKPLPWQLQGPVDLRPLRNVTCPFARWQGNTRACKECRWCPFRKQACCEMEDEIATLKSINVSGATDWDCFITIMHFQQCGRCSPKSVSYLMNKTLNYIWDPRGMSIRPCKQACRYIFGQCSNVKTLIGEKVIPDGVDVDTFCQDYPEIDGDPVPCFNGNSAGKINYAGVMTSLMLVSCLLSFFL